MALKGKVAVVTGAAQGLGGGLCENLLQNGAKVALLDVNEDKGKYLKAAFDKEYGPDRSLFLVCDVTVEEQMMVAFQTTIKKFARVDIFCNNAGILNENNWEKAVAINLGGVVRGSYLALDHMKKGNGGHGGVIVNISSIAGLSPVLSTPVYTATKYGVVGFSRALAEASDVAGYGVRINVLCPTVMRTPMLECLKNEGLMGQFGSLLGGEEKVLEQYGVVEVAEVAKFFLELVIDESKNGAVLKVQGKGAEYQTFPKPPV